VHLLSFIAARARFFSILIRFTFGIIWMQSGDCCFFILLTGFFSELKIKSEKELIHSFNKSSVYPYYLTSLNVNTNLSSSSDSSSFDCSTVNEFKVSKHFRSGNTRVSFKVRNAFIA